ncbi:MAG: hypothetical protein RL213_1328 [Bacteroidota bacterium]|jgi:hypothetical protein
MKKTIIPVLLSLLILHSGCSRMEDTAGVPSDGTLVSRPNPLPVPSGPALSRQDLDDRIVGLYGTNGAFKWTDTDLHTLWSAAGTTGLVALGYQPAGFRDTEKNLHNIDVKTGDWKKVHDALILLVIDELGRKGLTVTAADIVAEDDDVLPILILRLSDKDVITRLYNLQNTRYLEPYGYWPNQWVERSSSGCGVSTEPLNPADWTGITPGCLLPWNYNNLNIPAAWNIAQGNGVRIGVIDAGLSSTQPLLGSQFTDGFSNVSRTVTTDYTFGTSAYSTCSHGTSMCATAAGPRNAQNATTGIAYQSGLHFIRGCEDVVLDLSSELSGAKKALVKMGNLPDIRVISMSIGTPLSSSVLRDGVLYAYNKGKLIMAAAGTSFSWTSWWGVIYPAAYAECVAVTGVKENGSRCSSCHDGSQVLFTVPMERDANSGRNSLALKPSTTTPSYIGGSSVATSSAAGIAALVFSARPSLNRAQVVDILTRTAQFYPNRNSTKGFGNLNAGAAVTLAQTY